MLLLLTCSLLQKAPVTLETFQSVQQELLLLGGSVLLGFPAGLAFDITRLVRKVLPHNALLVALEDVLYLVLLSFLLLCYTGAFAGGQFRVYFAAGCLAGFLFYYCTLGVLVMRCSNLILYPLRWCWDRFVRIYVKCRSSFVKCAKKKKFHLKNAENGLQMHSHRVYNKRDGNHGQDNGNAAGVPDAAQPVQQNRHSQKGNMYAGKKKDRY